MPDHTALPSNEAHRELMLAADSDLIVRVVEAVRTYSKTAGEATTIKLNTDYHVLRSMLKAASPHFGVQISLFPLKATPTSPLLLSCSSTALEVWFTALHGGVNALPLRLYQISIKEIYNVIGVGQRYSICDGRLDLLEPFFSRWYEEKCKYQSLTKTMAEALVIPCFLFNHAEGFMKITKWLVYETRTPIRAYNPSSYQALHLDAQAFDVPIIGASNRVKFCLQRNLHSVLDYLHNAATCSCRKETAFDYTQALINCGVWPLEGACHRASINTILECLSGFEFEPQTVCNPSNCAHDYKASIERAITSTKTDFDGLCLDCMRRSRFENSGLTPEQYWRANYPYQGIWDNGCRFGHRRSTWVYSWQGTIAMRGQILRMADAINKEWRIASPNKREVLRAREQMIPYINEARLRHGKGETVTEGVRELTLQDRLSFGDSIRAAMVVAPLTGNDKENTPDSAVSFAVNGVDGVDGVLDDMEDDEFYDAEEDAGAESVLSYNDL